MKCLLRCASLTLFSVIVAVASPPARVARAAEAGTCPGDCNADGAVTINELIVGVNITLETEPIASCPTFDVSGDSVVTVNEIILGVNAALTDCSWPVSEVVARDDNGVAVHLGEMVTTEGVLTVSAGIFANNKLKVFAQEGSAGVMVYHETSSQVPAFQAGDRLQVHGVVRQQDPTSDANRAIGTVIVDVTHGSWQVLSSNNAQPSPQQVTLQTLKADGTRYTGAVVRIQDARKVAGNWPKVGDRSTQVTVSDDAGVTQTILRFQRNTITEPMVAKLDAIGDGPFTLSGIVVQDDTDDNGTLLDGFEIWVRGADDIQPES